MKFLIVLVAIFAAASALPFSNERDVFAGGINLLSGFGDGAGAFAQKLAKLIAERKEETMVPYITEEGVPYVTEEGVPYKFGETIIPYETDEGVPYAGKKDFTEDPGGPVPAKDFTEDPGGPVPAVNEDMSKPEHEENMDMPEHFEDMNKPEHAPRRKEPRGLVY